MLEPDGTDTLTVELQVPGVALWWPHTHGEPTLHRLTLGDARPPDAIAPTMQGTMQGTTQATTQAAARADTAARELGRVGFRRVTIDRGADGLGFTPLVNGVPVFCRGACWTSADLVTLAGERADHAPWLELARAAGMNMLRVGGTMIYESDAFYQLCDEIGLLVWQDFMFSNFDYPADDPAFIASVSDEAGQFLARTARHVSLAVICGGSEVEQQAAMLGLAEHESLQTLFTRTLPEIVAALRPDLHYVRNSPTGGALPFATNAGVSHYYGVGAYQRPLDDARRAGVRFASECLAFANVPDDRAVLDDLGAAPLHHPRWKQGVPRDPSAPWDFDDVRDFYLAALYAVDPPRLRYEDPERYLELSRAVTGEVMSDVFSEWRRAGSSCAGGIVWQFQDLRPGAGWGLVDVRRQPKAAWHALRQVWQPLQVLITDEGLNGLQVHLINEGQAMRQVRLDLHCLRDGATSVAAASRELDLGAHTTLGLPAAELLGRFFDFTYAYRFGPRAHDATVVTLSCLVTGEMLSQACYFPERRIVQRADLALQASVQSIEGRWWLELATSRLARWVHIVDPDFLADDDWFHLAPGQTRRVRLTPRHPQARTPSGEVRALNAFQPVTYQGLDERN
jgi:beta-mannosidase